MSHETLTNIEKDFRFYADASTEVITSGDGLRIANLVYQGMASPDYKMLGIQVGRRWPEFTREDTSLTMVIGQEQYAWPTTPDFKQPTWVEGIDSNSSEPYHIPWAPDMLAWSSMDYTGNAEPTLCRLIDVAGSVMLALRQTPFRTDNIRITGLIETAEFTTGESLTAFLNKSSDRAFSMLLAAEYKAKRGDSQRALELINNAVTLLPEQDNTPVLVGSGRVMPWGLGGGYDRHRGQGGHHSSYSRYGK